MEKKVLVIVLVIVLLVLVAVLVYLNRDALKETLEKEEQKTEKSPVTPAPVIIEPREGEEPVTPAPVIIE